MSAGQCNFLIEQGASWYRKLTWTDKIGQPIEVISGSAKMQIRTEQNSGGALLLELSTGNGMITLGADGVIELNISSAVTQGLSYLNSFYALEITINSVVTRLIEGKVTISPEVTV